MNKWYWIVCPRCGCPNDSMFAIDDDILCESAREYKKKNSKLLLDCCECDARNQIKDCKVVTDENL